MPSNWNTRQFRSELKMMSRHMRCHTLASVIFKMVSLKLRDSGIQIIPYWDFTIQMKWSNTEYKAAIKTQSAIPL